MVAADNRGGSRDASRSSTGLNRRRLLETTTGSAIAVSLAGCLDVGGIVAGDVDDDPITIGLLVPGTGDDIVGRSMQRTGRLVAEELSANGGIDGRDVDVVVADTKESAAEGRRKYQELLLEDDVDVTTGVFTSDVLEHIMPDIAEHETLHLTAGAATSAASRLVAEEYEEHKYHFRVGPTNDRHLAEIQLDFLSDVAADRGWDRVAVLAEDYEWNRTPWELLRDRLPEAAGVEIVMAERYEPSIVDFSDLYDRAENGDGDGAGADMVFMMAAHGGDAALVEWKFPGAIGSDGAFDPEMDPRPFELGGLFVPIQHPSYGSATDGLSRYAFTNTGRRTESELKRASRPFHERYRDANGQGPMHQSYYVYDAITLYADAVERAGTTDADALVDELEATSVTGTSGPIEFYGRDEEFPHDRVYDEEMTTYLQWQETEDGEPTQEIVWPDAQATADYEEPWWLRRDRPE